MIQGSSCTYEYAQLLSLVPVSCPARIHCTTVFALRNGIFTCNFKEEFQKHYKNLKRE